MKIRVDLYTKKGRYYTGGEVDLGDIGFNLDRADIAVKINNNQKIMVNEGLFNDFIVVTSINTQFGSEWSFCNFLFFPGEIEGYAKASEQF